MEGHDSVIGQTKVPTVSPIDILTVQTQNANQVISTELGLFWFSFFA